MSLNWRNIIGFMGLIALVVWGPNLVSAAKQHPMFRRPSFEAGQAEISYLTAIAVTVTLMLKAARQLTGKRTQPREIPHNATSGISASVTPNSDSRNRWRPHDHVNNSNTRR